uniref:C3H1-type domain-containing protein n=1 Tax=Neobodo designis TaxID=312471 RepID=A0A7S1W4H4_NEODS|mmetsp:Transcript_52313/g.161090  ORF Transcript_52313/g.161090 Transcript_52313/m.161090 type:complete len:255 (+) Transcript_52313:275-1039(+)
MSQQPPSDGGGGPPPAVPNVIVVVPHAHHFHHQHSAPPPWHAALTPSSSLPAVPHAQQFPHHAWPVVPAQPGHLFFHSAPAVAGYAAPTTHPLPTTGGHDWHPYHFHHHQQYHHHGHSHPRPHAAVEPPTAAAVSPDPPPQQTRQGTASAPRVPRRMPELPLNPAVRIGGPPAAAPPEVPAAERARPERYKTALCRHFARQQTCLLGARCRFAHGDSDLRTEAQNVAAGLVTEDAVEFFVSELESEAACAAPGT